MSTTLRVADGDWFILEETGTAEEIGGADKVSQDLADLYLTEYDVDRNWGSEFSLEKLGIKTPTEFKSMLNMRLNQSNQRMVNKQNNDLYLTSSEKISAFRAVAGYDALSQTGFFVSIANLEEGASVTQKGAVNFKPVSLRHVIPPPADISNKMPKDI